MKLKSLVLLLLATLAFFSIQGQKLTLKISSDGHHLVHADGKPFFYLGDTGWELFHRLDSTQALHYLENRSEKGFTVIQAVALAEFDGLHTPNAYGEIPLTNDDPTQPNEKYFSYVDYLVRETNRLGMVMGMLPTWGDKYNKRWGIGPEIFTPQNAFQYGHFLGARYKDAAIIWILGGDRIPEEPEDFQIIASMARGLREGDGGKHLITFHPMGGETSSRFFQDSSWLDFNLFQSGHGEFDNPNYRMTRHDYDIIPAKPVLDGEPNYEDHPINWTPANGWFDDFDSRRAGYWSMLAGACGNTYGCHDIWQFLSPKFSPVSVARTPWEQALDLPGAYQAGYMRHVFETRPWQRLAPHQDILQNAPNKGGQACLAACDREGTFLMVYAPYGNAFEVRTTYMNQGKLHAWWYHPATGTSLDGGTLDFAATIPFDPPGDPRRGNDWLLILDSQAAGFPKP
ncbi:MAG TPA: DUF4038 domain-containing protein [Saprospiraceae bacterium]|nr:DUF4038 domain-containing protein [Saprospiraceae bacterium]